MQTSTNICKNCGNSFVGKYCNHCGEKVYTEKDLSVIHFFEEGLHFITHFEGSFFTTLKTIFTRPGKLSLDYCYGTRKKYFKPLSFFLLLVVLYLLFPIFEGLNMKLYYYVHDNLYGPYALQKVKEMMANKNLTEPQLEQIFHQKAEKISKFLLLIIIPLTALWFWMLTFKKRKRFFDQMVFSAEINSVYLLWGFLILPVIFKIAEFISKLITGKYFDFSDLGTGIIMDIGLYFYVLIAAKRFYNLKRWQASGFALLFLVANFIVVQWLYKFLLFVITINQIH